MQLAAPAIAEQIDSVEESGRCQQSVDNDALIVAKDHFVERNGLTYAGTHLLLDLWGAEHLDELPHMEQALHNVVTACNATLLHIHLHHFSPNGGISGVAVLAESHISVHSWPERSYAAFDVFMCGDARPERAIPVLQEAFSPVKLEVREQLRGIVSR